MNGGENSGGVPGPNDTQTTDMSMSAPSIPVIDLAPYFKGTAKGKRQVAAAVDRACREIGFFTIVGHGVPPQLIDQVRESGAAFFALPLDEKRKVRRPAEEVSRGYNAFGDQALAYSIGEKSPPDLQESFGIGPDDVPDDPYYTGDAAWTFFALNLWPERPLALRSAFNAYFREMDGLSRTLMRIFAVALNLEEKFFDDKVDRPVSTLRVFHYPPQSGKPREGQLRGGAHTDYGTVTILQSDDAPGGLQVRRRDGTWVDVSPDPGALVVNIGDLMMCWTNDQWVSTLHRVANPPVEHDQHDRISLVFFGQANYDADIRCLESCHDADYPIKYPPTTTGNWFREKHMKVRYMSADA